MEQIVDVERLNRHLSELNWAPTVEISRDELIAVLSRLEQAEARVKLLESGIVADLVITSVHSARAIGTTVSGIADQLLKLGYDGLTERLEHTEQDRVKLRNRLDAMRRQRDGYRNQLRKTEQQIQRVREVLKAEVFEVRDYVTYKAVPVEYIEEALDGDTRRIADQGLGDNLARTTKNGENNE